MMKVENGQPHKRFARTRRVANWFAPLSEAGSVYSESARRLGFVGREWSSWLTQFWSAVRWYRRSRGTPRGVAAYSAPSAVVLRDLLDAARRAWLTGILLLGSVLVATAALFVLVDGPMALWSRIGLAIAFVGLSTQSLLIIITSAADARSYLRGEIISVQAVVRHPKWLIPWGA